MTEPNQEQQTETRNIVVTLPKITLHIEARLEGDIVENFKIHVTEYLNEHWRLLNASVANRDRVMMNMQKRIIRTFLKDLEMDTAVTAKELSTWPERRLEVFLRIAIVSYYSDRYSSKNYGNYVNIKVIDYVYKYLESEEGQEELEDLYTEDNWLQDILLNKGMSALKRIKL